MAKELVLSVTAGDGNGRFHDVQFDKKYHIFTDGSYHMDGATKVEHMYQWNSSTSTMTQVKDLVPYLVSNGGATGCTLSECPVVPAGSFITKYRGRIFMCNPATSRVYYSGTRTDLSTHEGSNDRPIKPWELWNIKMDLSRYNPGHGGSMIVGDVKQAITGIYSVESGLIIAKERSIYIWTWPDSAAPHEVTNGASIDMVIDGVGCVSWEGGKVFGDDLYFVGTNTFGRTGFYRLSGNELVELSEPVSAKFSGSKSSSPNKSFLGVDLTSSIKPVTSVFSNYCFILYDNGEGALRVRNVYDTINNCWIDFTSPAFTVVDGGNSTSSMLFGTTNGYVVSYPSFERKDIEPTTRLKTKIPFLVRTKRIDDGTPTRDKKFRKAWVSSSSSGDIDLGVNLWYDEDANSEPTMELRLVQELCLMVDGGNAEYDSTTSPTASIVSIEFWDNGVDTGCAVINDINRAQYTSVYGETDGFYHIYAPGGDVTTSVARSAGWHTVVFDTVADTVTLDGVAINTTFTSQYGEWALGNGFYRNFYVNGVLVDKMDTAANWSALLTATVTPVKMLDDSLGTYTTTIESEPGFEWDFEQQNVINKVHGRTDEELSLSERATAITMEVNGETDCEFSIDSIQVGWRERTQK